MQSCLIEAAEAEGRYDDANLVLDAWLARSPDDGDALYLRSRVTGWKDQFSLSHQRLVEASARAPDHPEIKAAMLRRRRYHSGPCDPPAAGLAASDSEPKFGSGAFVHPAVFEPGKCRQAVCEVERHVAASGGWTTSRHYSVPTTDIAIHTVPRLLAWFNGMLRSRVFPLVGAQFGVHPAKLRVIDAFIVKYNAEKQRSLPLHVDQSQFSLTIAMNPMEAFLTRP